MNNIAHLIRLANRIGDFFDAMPDRDAALDGIANHIHKFWEPRMRKALLDFLETNPQGDCGEAALNGITLAAILQHRERLRPKVATTAPPVGQAQPLSDGS
ncbi:MAG TPA: formate dehydrogenase subunit delta [Burkholderiaceae bacterium]|nr:formate dehydrogenase subunit delta [Burkholderiaceae bacterium]